jgi:hypothetical protein
VVVLIVTKAVIAGEFSTRLSPYNVFAAAKGAARKRHQVVKCTIMSKDDRDYWIFQRNSAFI